MEGLSVSSLLPTPHYFPSYPLILYNLGWERPIFATTLVFGKTRVDNVPTGRRVQPLLGKGKFTYALLSLLATLVVGRGRGLSTLSGHDGNSVPMSQLGTRIQFGCDSDSAKTCYSNFSSTKVSGSLVTTHPSKPYHALGFQAHREKEVYQVVLGDTAPPTALTGHS